MPYIISGLMFIFISLLLIPSKWLEANTIKKRMVTAPKVISGKKKLSIRRFTPLVINIMSLLNIRISVERREEMESQIQMADKDETMQVEDLMAMKAIAAVAVFGYFFFLGLMDGSIFVILLAVIMAVIGYLLPQQWLKIKGRKRKEQIRKELPYALNAIAIMSEAGMNLVPSLKELADKQDGVLSRELKKVTHDVSIGESQIRALEQMADRCQVEEVNRFVSALSQNIERGSAGITAVIRQQAKEVWEARKKNAQELGEKASMKLFFPLLLLALPATVIFILGPAILSIADFILSH
ncbi:type II secretion system F family protein [Geomicrobium sp. JSM 1781026]|uniref:type II secretion system F family protein n=1 Tax=Geomicrobium sp. JSM 1781026 TaxID=3344580 RepID=UPI0035C1AC2D